MDTCPCYSRPSPCLSLIRDSLKIQHTEVLLTKHLVGYWCWKFLQASPSTGCCLSSYHKIITTFKSIVKHKVERNTGGLHTPEGLYRMCWMKKKRYHESKTFYTLLSLMDHLLKVLHAALHCSILQGSMKYPGLYMIKTQQRPINVNIFERHCSTLQFILIFPAVRYIVIT